MIGCKFLDWLNAILWILIALMDGISLILEPARHQFSDFVSSLLLAVLFTAGATGWLVVAEPREED